MAPPTDTGEDAVALVPVGWTAGGPGGCGLGTAWHLATSTFTLCGRRGTYGIQLGLVTRLGPVWRRGTLRGRLWDLNLPPAVDPFSAVAADQVDLLVTELARTSAQEDRRTRGLESQLRLPRSAEARALQV
eukprot:s632_g2.t1